MRATSLDDAPAARTIEFRQDASVIGWVGLAHGTSHFSQLLLAPLFPVFMRDFGLSYAEVGLLMSVFFVISGIGQVGAGFVVDRIGAQPVLLAALGCFLLAALLAAQVSGYGGLLLVAVLAGLGNAPFHPVDFAILNQRVSPQRLGHAYSVHGLSGYLGWALAPVFLIGISTLADWRLAYWAAAVFYALVLALLIWQRDKLRTTVAPRDRTRPAGADLAYLRLPVLWGCFVFFMLSTMTLAVVQSYVPSILKHQHDIGLAAATLGVSAYMLCAAVGMLIGGFVVGHSQRRGYRSERVVALAISVGALLLLLCASAWLSAGATLLVLAATGCAVGVAGPSRDMMIRQATPAGATGRVYGTVYAGLDVGFAVSPLLFGLFMDRGWYALTLAGAALFLFLSALTALGVGRKSV
ncbi:MFS transporter [Hydrogenophaga sp.]|uniref:MFS transporter n=1 Tax=Hydrogenophaga sp. TaxID=1904254 RepID=UPI0019C143C8|nr:MFS transporter [Hydrogenophaga sp.]MBD3892522.1 MFS transporter [Hydrogenophaga sp.]